MTTEYDELWKTFNWSMTVFLLGISVPFFWFSMRYGNPSMSMAFDGRVSLLTYAVYGMPFGDSEFS